MLDINYVKQFMKAVELLKLGKDITQLDSLDNTPLSPEGFTFKVSDNIKEQLETLNYFRRDGTEFMMQNSVDSCDLELSDEQADSIIEILEDKFGLCNGHLSTKAIGKLLTQQSNRNFEQDVDCPMIKELATDKVKKYFDVLAALAYHKHPDLVEKLVASFDKKYDSFGIAGLEKCKIIDNRIYIPIEDFDRKLIQACDNPPSDTILNDAKYFVISKNLYDYFYCSWGSNIQSCFSLSSSYGGWYGMVPMGMTDTHFICYVTNGKAVDASMMSGKKFPCPQLYWRAWGWIEKDTNKLLIDRSFGKDDSTHRNFLRAFEDKFLKSIDSFVVDGVTHKTLKPTQYKKIFKEYDLHFYPDSITSMTTWQFRRRNGICQFRGEEKFRYKEHDTLYGLLQSFNGVSDTFNPLLPWGKDSKNTLINYKVCPKTNLIIDINQTEHPFAKYLNTPVDSTLVMTYLDGRVCVTATTRDSDDNRLYVDTTTISSGSFKNRIFRPLPSVDVVSIETLKQFLKENVDTSPFKVILLRVIENDTIKVLKFKQKGVF